MMTHLGVAALLGTMGAAVTPAVACEHEGMRDRVEFRDGFRDGWQNRARWREHERREHFRREAERRFAPTGYGYSFYR